VSKKRIFFANGTENDNFSHKNSHGHNPKTVAFSACLLIDSNGGLRHSALRGVPAPPGVRKKWVGVPLRAFRLFAGRAVPTPPFSIEFVRTNQSCGGI